jgi:hypothetical protein
MILKIFRKDILMVVTISLTCSHFWHRYFLLSSSSSSYPFITYIMEGWFSRIEHRRQAVDFIHNWTKFQSSMSWQSSNIFAESKAKNCEPRGKNVIPYPLGNGSNCGDPMYLSFYCDISTGKISFKTHNGTYNFTTINSRYKNMSSKRKM